MITNDEVYVYVRDGKEYVTPNIHVAFRRRTAGPVYYITEGKEFEVLWVP